MILTLVFAQQEVWQISLAQTVVDRLEDSITLVYKLPYQV